MITPEQLRLKLSKSYEVVGFRDLADLRTSTSEIFKFFKACFRQEFEPNQRVVLYSSYEPEIEFLNHVQKAAISTDISNYFILIVTPYDISKKLELVNYDCNNNDKPIKNVVQKLTTTNKFNKGNYIKDYSVLCAFPFSQLDINGTTVRPCCKIDLPFSIENIKSKSLDELFNGSHINNIRQRMIQGEKLKECSVCWNNEKTNSTSLRIHSLDLVQNDIYDLLDKPQLKIINFIPSNICNFKCRICSPYNSSKIAQEEFTYSNSATTKKTLDLMNESRTENNKIILENIHLLKDLQILHILGGEPFLWKDLSTLLEKLTTAGYAKNIALHISTNGSIFPTSLIKFFNNFKKVEILLSIDDIGPRFELQRGGNWNVICKNLDMFSNLISDKFDVLFAITVNIQNLLYLDEIVRFAESKKCRIVWTYLEHPSFLSIDNVTLKVKELTVSKYRQHNHIELRNIAHRIITTPVVNGSDFINFVDKLDQRRSENFKLNHSEIYNAMMD